MDELSYLKPAEPFNDFIRTAHDNEVVNRIPKRFSFSVDERSDDAIQVYLRVKPEVESEMSRDAVLSIVEDDNFLMVKKKKTVSKYKFTHIFKADTTQEEVFSKTATISLQDFFNGRNAFLFTYGTSSSGKTFTIQGTKKHPGLIPRILASAFCTLDNAIDDYFFFCPERSCSVVRLSEDELIEKLTKKDSLIMCAKMAQDMFSKNDVHLEDLQKLKKEMNNLDISLEEDNVFSIWVSFAEIYNEKIYDLLEEPKDARVALSLATDLDKRAFIKGLRHIPVTTLEEAYLLYFFGCHNRSVHYTALNDKSSRSHSVFTIKIVSRTRGSEDVNFASSFSVCDLAGTERFTKTRNYGSRMKESQSINSSFLVLNRCLKIIRENQLREVKQIVPYRESKLTQIMGRSFTSGDTNLIMIVTVTQARNLMDETEASLKSSAVATEIKASLQIPVRQKKIMRFSTTFSHLDPGRGVNWNELLSKQAVESRLPIQHSNMNLLKELEIEKRRRKEAEEKLANMEKVYQVQLDSVIDEQKKISDESNELVKSKELEVSQSFMEKQKQYETLKKQFDELYDKYMEGRANNLKLKKQLRLLKDDYDQLQEKNKSLESTNDKLEDMLDDAKEEVETLQEDIKQLNLTLVNKDEDLAIKDEKIGALEVEIGFLEENLMHNDSERGAYEKLVSKLDKDLEEKSKELEELKKSLENQRRLETKSRNTRKLKDKSPPDIQLFMEDDSLIGLKTPNGKCRSAECLNAFSDSEDPAFVLPRAKSKTTAKKKKKRLVKDLESSYYFDDANTLNPEIPARRKLYEKISGDTLAEPSDSLSRGTITQDSPSTILRTLRTRKKR